MIAEVALGLGLEMGSAGAQHLALRRLLAGLLGESFGGPRRARRCARGPSARDCLRSPVVPSSVMGAVFRYSTAAYEREQEQHGIKVTETATYEREQEQHSINVTKAAAYERWLEQRGSSVTQTGLPVHSR